MKKEVEVVNQSGYIEVAVHEVYHGYYSTDNPSHDIIPCSDEMQLHFKKV